MDMKPSTSVVLLVGIVLGIVTAPSPGNAQSHVKVTSQEATIYGKPDSGASLAISARKGDIFEAVDMQEHWTQIHLFSGAERYIQTSKVVTVGQVPPYLSDPSKRNKLCSEVNKARQKAAQKAMSKYSGDLDQKDTYEQLLTDRYLLKAFSNFDVAPAHFPKLIECVNNGLPNSIRL